ncbi:hypothetical protein [Priestia megaterium]|uniref:hypothetical protein n=1 Tax=Priestia megaterium TaxID=1404 RepID=UPI000BFBBBFF|nr:hypothetical protein [Priestia megaterium]PGY48497.1 hypothetical protein COE35_23810 [Priestia megaterium]
MSYYDKKYIKGEHKKDCHEDDYKKHCKKDDCKEDHHEKEEEKGIYTELQVKESVQIPATGNIPDTPQVSTLPPLVQVARKSICIDDFEDRVFIETTVEWAPVGTLAITAPGQSGIRFIPPFAFSIPVSFKVWRKNRSYTGSNTPELIFETTDSSPIFAALRVGVGQDNATLSFGIVTTNFHYVDRDAPAGDNEYIVTMEPGTIPAALLPTTNGIVTGFLPEGITLGSAVSSYVLTLSEIEANN